MLHWYCKATYNLGQIFFSKATYNLGRREYIVIVEMVTKWSTQNTQLFSISPHINTYFETIRTIV